LTRIGGEGHHAPVALYGRLVAILIFCSAIARAQSVNDQELARAHYLLGQSAYNKTRYTEALHEFQEAFRLSRRPAFHYNIGICQERLGHLDDAIASYERYLAEDRTVPDRADVESHIDALKEKRQAELTAQAAAAHPPPPAATVAPVPRADLVAQPPVDKPVYKKPWFWGVIGGGAAVVIIAVAVGVAVASSGGDSVRTLSPVRLHP
jgi:tetratricopeptide (TPR) repeat protein